jgi:hypothetical protein
LFGTVKRVLWLCVEAGGGTALQDLRLVRTWYNHLRPHQNLDGLTPAEAWSGKPADRQGRPVWCSEWDGVLSGYWWPG